MLFVRFLFSCLLISFHCQCAITTFVNITVDDQFGDPSTHSQISYMPPDAWSIAPNCSHCPDNLSLFPAKAYNRTWHDGAVRPGTVRSASLQFYGKLHVFDVILHSHPHFRKCSMIFFIDGVRMGSYSSELNSAQDQWMYDVVVFQNTSLAMTKHQLLIQSGQENGPDTIILLDYIMYS
ncbi:hypothetical protein BDP27DRAFT_1527923 [Rhodocollybia butyracea]|uniref:Uncharacterized protein n=1 Tax=Rhodocollybia butyracea TaxID=206335 RepID=A0A9P5PSS8_9AGAR|nr:hypothetical protein BDP27DRAFT_1527923 [Rhodocollybia butyracea]